jgi:hypothetical protein
LPTDDFSKKKQNDLAGLKRQLQDLIKQPLIPKGISQKYLTSIQGMADTVLSNGSLSSMPTVKQITAISAASEKSSHHIKSK